MKKTVKSFIILLIIGIVLSSCLVKTTKPMPSETPQEDGIDLSGQMQPCRLSLLNKKQFSKA